MFDYRRFPRKINVGCGWDLREGYLNVDAQDFHKPDLVADVTNLDMLPAGYYEEVLACDVLEHIGRTGTLQALAEWNRLLAVGGLLRLRVPNVLGLADLLRRQENQSAERHEELVQCLFGTQAYTEDFHRTTFTELLLRDFLQRAGFSVVSLDEMHTWLFDVVASKVREPELGCVGSPGEFVTRCYAEILGREPDDEGRRFFVGKLEARELNRRQVADIISSSEEARTRRR